MKRPNQRKRSQLSDTVQFINYLNTIYIRSIISQTISEKFLIEMNVIVFLYVYNIIKFWETRIPIIYCIWA